MTTQCTDPTNMSLQGTSGIVHCVPYKGDLEIYKHGFIEVSANGRYFIYHDGTPFFYLGDTHWLVSHERFGTSNVPGVASEFKYTVDKRVGQGFTVYQIEPIQQPHGGIHTASDEEPFYNLRDGLSDNDMPGFKNLDAKFQYIANRGLVISSAMLCWALDPAEYPKSYTKEYMALLGRYWSARYGAYPVLWTVAQEIDPPMYGHLNDEALAKWMAAAESLVAADAYNLRCRFIWRTRLQASHLNPRNGGTSHFIHGGLYNGLGR